MNIPTTMNAFVLMRHGDMDALEYKTDWPVPQIDPSEVLIKVSACGMNNTDVNTRTGWYSKSIEGATTGDVYEEAEDKDSTWSGVPLDLPRIQGADAVGIVVACGVDADQSLLGKRVIIDCWLDRWKNPLDTHVSDYFGSECDGGYAEYTKVDYRNVATVDTSMSDAELATFSTAYSTAEGMLNRANVSSGDRVLITGASGGVGSAAIQLCKRRGAYVVAMSSLDKYTNVMKVNPDAFVSRDSDCLGEALESATGFDTVNVVLDLIGGDYFSDLINVLARSGRYATSGAIAGSNVSFDLRTLYIKDLTLYGSSVVKHHVFSDIVKYIERGEIKPILSATYPLEKLQEAQEDFIKKKHVGNIVITTN